MILIVRGIVWYGLYLSLILLPLVTAALTGADTVKPPSSFLAAVGIGLGFVGLSLMALEFALISRIKAAAAAFGEDSLQLFHNLMGMVALGLLLVHPFLLIISGYPAACWLNPFADCANASTRGASLALYALLILVGSSVWRRRLGIRYEAWQVLHGLLALFVLYAALVHITIIGRYTRTLAMEIVWWIYILLVTGLILWYKILRPLLRWNQKWEVIENRVELGDSRTLVLKPVGHDGFNFQPGQFSWLKAGRTPFGLGQHPISMSSAGDVEPGGTVSFTIRNLGDWSGEQVPALKPGDIMWLDGPHGVFSMDREQAMGYVFIGGGVGITPLHSMCQTMAKRGDPRPVVLFYGAKDEESLTLIDELQELTGRMNLTVVPVLTDPSDEWQGETGFITADIMRRYVPKQVRWFKFLICGPEPLMDAMEEALPAVGIPPENVLTERFDMV
jgi:predicted ferric reductase